MATSRQMRKFCSSLLLPRCIKRCERAYAAAAMAVQDFDYWELPLPVLHDTHAQRTGRGPQWIFLGSPGVGKATYASRLAKLLNVPHISMGSLLRKEASLPTSFAKELASIMRQGMLVPDDAVFSILSKRLEQKIEFEGSGFIFDGFPRTINQAEILDQVAEVDLVVNMKLREGVLARHRDRCHCLECGCSLETQKENTCCCPKCKAIAPLDTVIQGQVNILRERQQLYTSQCKPVEHFYRKQGKLLDFEVAGGIPQTWPRLLSALRIEDSEAILQQQLPM
ncbi:hypothetical protein GOP47_0016332 [Adiantum capillus-veneris]|uniref:adenylate kinase n=1 Tax=Adiantum capillus-veneris TaxID=13818 RepID=A0A9D4ZBN0_ADICA|nr:hypothetical protein GOP47_0016332 [Adiantum capillus-veneris]